MTPQAEAQSASGSASMGPRSTDHGNRCTTARLFCRRRASMGPRSTDRGNVPEPQSLAGKVALQWGRDRLIAEMSHFSTGGTGFHTLQWGRDRLIAEMTTCTNYRLARGRASMGPRSTDRGNTYPLAAWTSRLPRLQWGRDRLIAEISPAESTSRITWDASMGPRSTDRGNPGPFLPLRERQKASMGPRSTDRGNGLVPNSMMRCCLLQWGRDRLIAEMNSP